MDIKGYFKSPEACRFTFPGPAMASQLPKPFDFSSCRSSGAYLASEIQNGYSLAVSRPRKRSRASSWSSLDESDLPSKKKRRHRLDLITSPLSRPFSTPASHIADHGTSRIAVWAKTRQLKGHSLRRAAILNSAQRKFRAVGSSPNSIALDVRLSNDCTVSSANIRSQTSLDGDMIDEAGILGTIRKENPDDGIGIPGFKGISNYDEFDDWKGYDLLDQEDDPGGSSRIPQNNNDTDENGEVYSDFNFLDPIVTSPVHDDDYDDPFTVLPPDWYEDDRDTRILDNFASRPPPIGSAA